MQAKFRHIPFLFISLIACSALASSEVKVPTSRDEFCAQASNLDNFKQIAQLPEMRMAEANYGGLMDGGVCWWHSRMQRAAIYLTVYRPELPKPNKEEAQEIIERLSNYQEVVEIPGYANFEEFSAAWYQDIQSRLEFWQKKDGIAQQVWIDGLMGHIKTSPSKLKKMMDDLYEEVETKGRITYQKLQMPGIVSHAWLVIGMKKTSNGYEISYIDSNYPSEVSTHSYRNGDTQITEYDGFVPYIRQRDEFREALVNIVRYCQPQLAADRWIKALLEVRSQSAGSAQVIDQKINRLKETGHFDEFLKGRTLTDKETLPSNWSKLMRGNAQ